MPTIINVEHKNNAIELDDNEDDASSKAKENSNPTTTDGNKGKGEDGPSDDQAAESVPGVIDAQDRKIIAAIAKAEGEDDGEKISSSASSERLEELLKKAIAAMDNQGSKPNAISDPGRLEDLRKMKQFLLNKLQQCGGIGENINKGREQSSTFNSAYSQMAFAEQMHMMQQHDLQEMQHQNTYLQEELQNARKRKVNGEYKEGGKSGTSTSYSADLNNAAHVHQHLGMMAWRRRHLDMSMAYNMNHAGNMNYMHLYPVHYPQQWQTSAVPQQFMDSRANQSNENNTSQTRENDTDPKESDESKCHKLPKPQMQRKSVHQKPQRLSLSAKKKWTYLERCNPELVAAIEERLIAPEIEAFKALVKTICTTIMELNSNGDDIIQGILIRRMVEKHKPRWSKLNEELIENEIQSTKQKRQKDATVDEHLRNMHVGLQRTKEQLELIAAKNSKMAAEVQINSGNTELESTEAPIDHNNEGDQEKEVEKQTYRPTRDMIPSPTDAIDEDSDASQQPSTEQGEGIATNPSNKRKRSESPIDFYVKELLAEEEGKESAAPKEQPKRLKAQCTFEGCQTLDKGGGWCKRHRPADYLCTKEGCNRMATSEGHCWEHDGRKMCKREGCTVYPKTASDFCGKHRCYHKKCIVEGCDKRRALKDYCYHHGPIKKCKVEGCEKWAVCRGICCDHGAPRFKRKQCAHDGCVSYASSRGGFCYRHASNYNNTKK